jgi:Raf kinase inhibitor-like YbhB/YbcL family protein
MHDNDPFDRLPEAATFTVTSPSVEHGHTLPSMHLSAGLPGGQDRSPELTWSGAPAGTQSYAVTMYDPDAPTGSGFWHWAVANIPADTTHLPEGAGSVDTAALPEGAHQIPNDARVPGFIGAAPPAGHGPHRYFITVHALDITDAGVPADGTPAYLGFVMSGHTLGRATLIATAETPAGN